MFSGAVLLPLLLLCALTVAVVDGRSLPWDSDALRFAERHYQASIVTRLDLALKLSLGVCIAIVIGALAMFLAGKKRSRALFWTLTVGGVLALDLPLKEIFHRPTLGLQGEGYSFPSGNAMASVAVVTALVLTCPGRWRRWVLVFGVPAVVGYGVALVYAWWHYPSDVLGGWCVALLWVAVLWLMLRRRWGAGLASVEVRQDGHS